MPTQTQPDMPVTWTFDQQKHWKITATLETLSSLHIGNGDEFTTEIRDSQGKQREIHANAFIHADNTPIIPGSTLKGKLRAWLEPRLNNSSLLDQIFGSKHLSDDEQGNAGLAEFHDAHMIQACENLQDYPNNQPQRSTWIEASTAIDRHTGAAKHTSLHYTECVPPKTQFLLTISGAMTDQQAGILIHTLKGLANDTSALSFGAENANNKGRMELLDDFTVKQLDHSDIIQWLKTDSDQHRAINHFRTLKTDKSNNEVQSLTQAVTDQFKSADSRSDQYTLNIQFDGPFMVNDPSQNSGEISHQPLTDANGNPVLPTRSVRGALRSQAERIIRTMGGQCCDSKSPCKDTDNRCVACEMFGATGWKTTVDLSKFDYQGEHRATTTQQFVAIDRFHGGGKDTALFDAEYFENPVFEGLLSLNLREQNEQKLAWRKGLLALLFRDLQEGDITFGFGSNKGYGKIKRATITGNENISDADIEHFRQECQAASTAYPCDEIATPETNPALAGLPNIQPSNDGNLSFHNPYHFVPVKAPNTSNWFDKATLQTSRSPHSHAFYRSHSDSGEKLHHGRIICKLTAETPLFVGKGDAPDNEQGQLKEHYQLNGELAIPATSLRGMISSLAEAASNSAMRVLDNGYLTYRKPMVPNQLLSALGIVVIRDNEYFLIPMALPTLALNKQTKKYQLDNRNGNYQKIFPDGEAKLKVYLNNAYSNGAMKTFLETRNTWSINNNEIYYLPLGSNQFQNNSIDDDQNLRKPSSNNKFVLGQKINNKVVPSDISNQYWTPGIIRILGKEDREEEIPNTKKHELFIPVPDEFVENCGKYLNDATAFPIPKNVIDRFEAIAKKQTDSQDQSSITNDAERLPFSLKGTARATDHTLKIKHGDIVYFKPDQAGDEIEEISFSSIWRDEVDGTEVIDKKTNKRGTVCSYIPPKLLPLEKDRQKISPAELLFGFVELNENKDDRDHALAYKGKVRISAATLAPDFQGKDNLQAAEIMLKALSSPKLPSPALYFKPKQQDGHIPKQDLNTAQHQIQGRKMYLHALRKTSTPSEIEVQKLSAQGAAQNNQQAKYPWETSNPQERPEMKVRIKPVKKNSSFYFQLEFNNLTEWELGLLCYTLQPNNSFRHRLGMGKPIGLGSVKLEIAALQTINRQQRYSSDPLTEPRYNDNRWSDNSLLDEQQKQYPDDTSLDNSGPINPHTLSKVFSETMDADIQQAIELIGNPGNIKHPVHYPQVSQKDIENENFKWFVENDENQHKSLTSINETTTSLPTLKKY